MTLLTDKQLKALDEVYGNDNDAKAKHRELLEKQAALPIGIYYACRHWMFMPAGTAKPGDVVREDDGDDNDVEWQLGEQVPVEEYVCTLKKFNDTSTDCFKVSRCVGATLPPSARKFGIIRYNTEKFSSNLHTRRSKTPGEDCECCKHFGFITKTDVYGCCSIEVANNPDNHYATAMDYAGD